jgi:hypothetical protein
MAIGQIADYRRFVKNGAKAAVLVPEQPRPDILALLESQTIAAIWPTSNGFADTTRRSLT